MDNIKDNGDQIVENTEKNDEGKVMQTRSLRADADTITRFKAVASNFPTQGECLKDLIASYDLGVAQKSFDESREYIIEYRKCLSSFNNIFLDAMREYHDAFLKKEMLEGAKNDMDHDYNVIKAENEQLKKYIKKLEKENSNLARSGNNTHIGQLKAEHDDYREEASKLRTDLDNAKLLLAKKEETIFQLNKALEDMKMEFAQQKKEYQAAAEQKITEVKSELLDRISDNLTQIAALNKTISDFHMK